MRKLLAAAAPALTHSLAAPTGLARPAATATDTPAAMRTIVHAWSARLNANDNAGVARLFAVPAIIRQGDLIYRLTTRKQLTIWHDGLPCGGTISQIIIRGRFATAVFVLGMRRGHTCQGLDAEAAARFEIVGGKIRSWTQVAVPDQTGPVA